MAADLISVEEAREIIANNTRRLKPIKCSLSQAAGKVLAEDVFASVDVPAYPQSSMDGYAFAYNNWKAQTKLRISGEVAAGNNEEIKLSPGAATRIFTGAAVPAGADTVVMQEKVKTENGFLVIEDPGLTQGSNVRARGSEIKSGTQALSKDTLLTPGAIGFLAGIGIAEINVYPRPKLSIIVTGNELQVPGKPLDYGQVYESNSFTLQAALKQLDLEPVNVYRSGDDLQALAEILGKALAESDVVFLTGGVSVGAYDFVVSANRQNGVEKLFHKIRQRPGKPIFFGRKDQQLVFGLPGNPASVLTCFYEYVEPALQKMSGQQTRMRKVKALLPSGYKKTKGLTHFLKGFYDGENVKLLEGQESYRMSSFATANCLVRVDEDVTIVEEGEWVEVHLLPV